MENLSAFLTNFDADTHIRWAANHWHLSVYIAIFYIVATFVTQHVMQSRNPMNLRRELFYWNVFLAVYSAVTSYKTIGKLISVWYNQGFYNVTCTTWMFYDEQTKFWIWLFPVSKIVELVDTSFIVLRKNRLIFLHWYHHATVLVYCWYAYGKAAGTGTWFIALNAFVHTIMYSYYALKATGQFKISKKVNLLITTLQTVQMIVGCGINIYAAHSQFILGKDCTITKNLLMASGVMYFSYLVLFANFFFKTYLRSPKPKEKLS
ncbi:Elongation of very long chain fatty acids protein 6 [Trichoplax sp. H2]|nr:Elongation of very long chain fatty acids protein 6 [Trichoplax sp. H2]|eukprot:RDD46918.1 Elongation of very long chain fatty acids protein 6 [Trichoplax sp. H2]